MKRSIVSENELGKEPRLHGLRTELESRALFVKECYATVYVRVGFPSKAFPYIATFSLGVTKLRLRSNAFY